MNAELEKWLKENGYRFSVMRDLTSADGARKATAEVDADLLNLVYGQSGLDGVKDFLAAEMRAWEEGLALGQV